MKRKYLPIILMCLLYCSVAVLSAQDETPNNEQKIYSNALREKITLFTDRSMYTVGEDILFKAVYRNDANLPQTTFSTVLYMELIKPDGTAMQQLKYPLTNKGISGQIQIPNNLLSGIYYLKAYTKWMRNYSVQTYGYQQIKIINPTNTKVNQTNNKQNQVQTFKQAGNIPNLVLSIDKANFKTREKVNVSFHVDKATENNSNYCISVVKSGSKDLSKSWIETKYKLPNENEIASFYPEINGISISGKVLDNSNKQRVAGAMVNMALLSTTSFFSATQTNKQGEFFLSFPNTNQVHEFYINAEKEDLDLSIELDKDFCNKPTKLNTTRFSLSEKENIIATEICVNAQITQAYKELNDSILIKQDNHRELSFYGKPQEIYYAKDYIELPFLRDYISEIVSGVKLYRNQLIQTFNTSKNNSLKVFPYLLMIDNIPISDETVFLNISNEKIERIELINSGYVANNQKYCGIISVFTKNNDVAGIELPKNYLFFNYKLLNGITESTTNTAITVTVNAHSPDRRNCLYWNPNMEVSSSGESHFSFFTSDVSGEYQIIIQTISKSGGHPLFYKSTFIVR